MSLSPAPLSLLIKAAPILTDDMYGDIQPAAWELLLSVDEHMAAAAGHRFTHINLTVGYALYKVVDVVLLLISFPSSRSVSPVRCEGS